MSALQILRFEIDSVLKILNKRITESMNEILSNGGDCRTALATPGWLKTESQGVDVRTPESLSPGVDMRTPENLRPQV